MQESDLTDTIAAIATSAGESGIGIVRISGKDALAVAGKIFVSKNGQNPLTFKTYTLHYGYVVSGSKIIDEVILTLMRSPHSFTKEDVVEINCHGGIVAVRAVLELVLENGARLAHPGEFTKRAFLNGRIDLMQAEAVLDVIRAKTDSALKMSIGQLNGNLSKKIKDIREDLIKTLSALEASIDFPDEELPPRDLEQLKKGLKAVDGKLTDILNTSRHGRILRDGIHVVICGRPNVGKSSLLNALLREERCIVTPVAGTTRDTIEEIIDIKGVPVRIVDTAGILEPRDLIEKKAVLRSRRQINMADLVIVVFDGSQRFNLQDKILIRKLKKKAAIAIINKIDLKQRINKEKIMQHFNHIIEISAKRVRNIDLLENAIADLVYRGNISQPETLLVNNLRHIEALRNSEKSVAEAVKSLDNDLSLEFAAEGIKNALKFMDTLTGKDFSEDLLDKIFGDFCIGK